MKNKKHQVGEALTEKAFESQVKDLAKLFGWKYYHTWRSIHSPAGFPDCVMVRDGLIVFAELKSEKGKLTEEQKAWIKELEAVAEHSLGVMVFVWRPSQIEKIVEILR